jgi:hypothetical protein
MGRYSKAVGFAFVLILLLAACVRESGVTTVGAVSSETLATETSATTSNVTVWANWTDEVAGFQIDYPDDWVGVHTGEIAEIGSFLDQARQGQPADEVQVNLVVLAQNPETPYPSAAVSLISSSAPRISADDVVEQVRQRAESGSSTFELVGLSDFDVDGADAVVMHSSFDASEVDSSLPAGRWHSLDLFLPADWMTWRVNCATFVPSESDVEEDIEFCQMVFESFGLIAP